MVFLYIIFRTLLLLKFLFFLYCVNNYCICKLVLWNKNIIIINLTETNIFLTAKCPTAKNPRTSFSPLGRNYGHGVAKLVCNKGESNYRKSICARFENIDLRNLIIFDSIRLHIYLPSFQREGKEIFNGNIIFRWIIFLLR